MSEKEIRVSWRAAILHENGGTPTFGYLRRLGQSKAVVRVDINLKPGHQYSLAAMLPRNAPGEEIKIIEWRGVVAMSVLSSAHFNVTFESLEMADDGKALLNTYIEDRNLDRKTT